MTNARSIRTIRIIPNKILCKKKKKLAGEKKEVRTGLNERVKPFETSRKEMFPLIIENDFRDRQRKVFLAFDPVHGTRPALAEQIFISTRQRQWYKL